MYCKVCAFYVENIKKQSLIPWEMLSGELSCEMFLN